MDLIELSIFNKNLVEKYERKEISDLEYYNGKLFVSLQIDKNSLTNLIESTSHNFIAVELLTNNEIEGTLSNDPILSLIELKRYLNHAPYTHDIIEINGQEENVYCFSRVGRFYIKKIN